MKARISGSVAGHLELEEGDRFDFTGHTYTGSPVYTIEVHTVRPKGRYGTGRTISVHGPRRLKSGRLGDVWYEMDVPDTTKVPDPILAAVEHLKARVSQLREVFTVEQNDTRA